MRRLMKKVLPQETQPPRSRSTDSPLVDRGDLGADNAKTAITLLDYGIGQSQGTRPYQEDCYKILLPGSEFGQHIALFAVYDGHGGASVSTFAKQHLHSILQEQLAHQHGPDAFDTAVTKSFQEVDRRLRKQGIGYSEGSTVSLALVNLAKRTLVTADLGDSYAFIGMVGENGKCQVVKLSQLQTPEIKSERERIEEAGGVVEEDDDGDRIGGVNMSRALGDLKLKIPVPTRPEKRLSMHHPTRSRSNSLDPEFSKTPSRSRSNSISISESADSGPEMLADLISNIPHTNHIPLTGAPRYILLLASDGIGEEKDAESSLRWVAKELDQGTKATFLARTLADRSSQRMEDNSTVLIAVFK